MSFGGSDKRNLISVGVVGGLFLAVVIAGVIGNVRSGNYIVLPIVFTAFGICGMAIWFSHFRVRILLRDRTPDRIIAHYHRSVRRIPNADAASAYLSAMAAAFFGQFERARQELSTVDWAAVPTNYQGHRLYVLALLAILEENDDAKAIAFAEQAHEIDKIQLLEDVIFVVANEPTPDRIERLERTAKKQQGLIPGMCAWAMALHSKRMNLPDIAGDYKAILRLAMPYCLPLTAGTDVDRLDVPVTKLNGT